MESEVRGDYKVQFVTYVIIALALYGYLIYNLDWWWRALVTFTFFPLLFFPFYPPRFTISDSLLYLKKGTHRKKTYNLKSDIETVNTSFTSQTRGAFVFRGYEILVIVFKDGKKLKIDQNQYKNYFALKDAIYNHFFFNKI